jgi:hypothetical protein
MREARIAMRTIDAAWSGEQITDDDLRRMADTAERIAIRKIRLEQEQATAIAWLKAKRDQMGLTALAQKLGIDASNCAKVIDGRRKLSPTFFAAVADGRSWTE